VDRYFIVIDELWEKNSWETLKLAIPDDKNSEGRIIITTRKWGVAKIADEVYKLPPLPHDSCQKLFYTRIYGDERKYVDYQPDKISEEILRKCEGIPLAIITMASLLVDEPRDRWFELYKSVGFGCKENEESENIIKKILSFSYYDLPSHLRTCLLYLSAFPEDSVIPKVSLVWMWAAEGFVQKQKGKGLFEIGEGYFNDLINRSLIQEVDPDYDGSYSHGIHGCRVHDMVLDFIRSMSHEENFFARPRHTCPEQRGS
jgi:disease resistance protein RPM1